MLFNRPDNPQNCPLPWDLTHPPFTTWLLGPTQVYLPISISISLAVFAGLMNVTNTHTHTMLLTCSSSPHLVHGVCEMWLKI